MKLWKAAYKVGLGTVGTAIEDLLGACCDNVALRIRYTWTELRQSLWASAHHCTEPVLSLRSCLGSFESLVSFRRADGRTLIERMAAVQSSLPPLQAHEAKAQRGALVLPRPSDIHVLLVDDEKLSRTVVGNLLRKCDYKGERARLINPTPCVSFEPIGQLYVGWPPAELHMRSLAAGICPSALHL